jgi:outer membrane protein OmpA-like peptidoglycan-associated protein
LFLKPAFLNPARGNATIDRTPPATDRLVSVKEPISDEHDKDCIMSHSFLAGFATRALAALTIAGAIAVTATTASAENISADQIVRALTKKPLTRSLSGTRTDPAAAAREDRFIESLRNRTTRSLSLGEREQIATVVADKPTIDLEINFEYNSAEISAGALPAVAALGKALADPSLKGATFLVAGHTDAAGTDAYNQDLSERRADTIKRTLVEKYGINASDLVSAGYGESRLKKPTAPMDAANRRVQVVTMSSQTAAAQ